MPKQKEYLIMENQNRDNKQADFTAEQLSQKWFELLNQKVVEAIILEKQVVMQDQLIKELGRKEAELTDTIESFEERVEVLEKSLRQTELKLTVSEAREIINKPLSERIKALKADDKSDEAKMQKEKSI